MMRDYASLSPVMLSNLYTMQVCSDQDKRQVIGAAYTIPSEEIRRLRAMLILEEALEIIKGLGFDVRAAGYPEPLQDAGIKLDTNYTPDLEQIIDGVCDLDYVGTGTLASCGVPDAQHRLEVCEANNRKFPGGKAIFNASGKFLKPEGWQGPNHLAIQERELTFGNSLQIAALELIKER